MLLVHMHPSRLNGNTKGILKKMDNFIRELFGEEQLYIIDHVGKETSGYDSHGGYGYDIINGGSKILDVASQYDLIITILIFFRKK